MFASLEIETNKSKLFQEHGCICQLCDTNSNRRFLGVHHIVHQQYGGSDEIDNLRWVCWKCHKKIHRLFNIASGIDPLTQKSLFEIKTRKTKKRKQKFNNNSNSNRRFMTYRAA
jgi:HNH endonuclease